MERIRKPNKTARAKEKAGVLNRQKNNGFNRSTI